MLETSNVYRAAFRQLLPLALTAGVVSACAVQESQPEPQQPVAVAPAPPAPKADPAAAAQEARALLAQAETDIQRARAKRALWLKAWESLVLARQAASAENYGAAKEHSRRASEFAQLGLEQLAYPAIP